MAISEIINHKWGSHEAIARKITIIRVVEGLAYAIIAALALYALATGTLLSTGASCSLIALAFGSLLVGFLIKQRRDAAITLSAAAVSVRHQVAAPEPVAAPNDALAAENADLKEQLKKEKKVFYAQVDLHSSDLQANRTYIGQLKTQIDDLQREKTLLSRSESRLQAEITALKTQLQQNSCENLEQSLKEKERELSKVKLELEQQTFSLDRQEKELQEKEKLIRELTVKGQTLENQQASLNRRAAEAEKQTAALRGELESERAVFTQKMAAYQRERVDLQSELNKKTTDFQNERTAYIQANEALQQKNKKLEEDKTNLLRDWDASAAFLSGKVNKLKVELAQARAGHLHPAILVELAPPKAADLPPPPLRAEDLPPPYMPPVQEVQDHNQKLNALKRNVIISLQKETLESPREELAEADELVLEYLDAKYPHHKYKNWLVRALNAHHALDYSHSSTIPSLACFLFGDLCTSDFLVQIAGEATSARDLWDTLQELAAEFGLPKSVLKCYSYEAKPKVLPNTQMGVWILGMYYVGRRR